MDCDNARLFLPFVTPGGKDLNGPEAAELHAHLEQCSACNAMAMNAGRLDQHLGRAMRDVPVPVGMKGRILQRLADQRAAVRRHWLKRAGAFAAVAAALLLTLWLGSGRPWPGDPQVIDPREVHYPVSLSGYDQEKVKDALVRLGYPENATAPNYRYEYLVGEPALADLPGYPGKKVPQLIFVDPPVIPLQQEREAREQGAENRQRPARRAIVYVLPPKKFNKFKVEPEAVLFHDEYRYNVALDRRDGCECLVLYDGESYGWLLPPKPRDEF